MSPLSGQTMKNARLGSQHTILRQELLRPPGEVLQGRTALVEETAIDDGSGHLVQNCHEGKRREEARDGRHGHQQGRLEEVPQEEISRDRSDHGDRPEPAELHGDGAAQAAPGPHDLLRFHNSINELLLCIATSMYAWLSK